MDIEHDVREMFYEHASYGKPLSRKQFHRALDRILKKKHDDTAGFVDGDFLLGAKQPWEEAGVFDNHTTVPV